MSCRHSPTSRIQFVVGEILISFPYAYLVFEAARIYSTAAFKGNSIAGIGMLPSTVGPEVLKIYGVSSKGR